MTETTPFWYRKRTDPPALYLARALGCAEMFSCIGPRIHRDDLGDVAAALELDDVACGFLFAAEEIS